jgi:MFS family permease
LFCVQIDYFALNVALPRMAKDLGSTTTDLQWVISVYMLALGAFMAPAGRIGDIFGRRRALLLGMWICVAIGVAAFATSLILKPRSAPVAPASSRLTTKRALTSSARQSLADRCQR